MFGIPNKDDINNIVKDVPKNLFLGLAHAAMFLPEKAKGAVVFGENIWNGMTPEQQATVEAAITKLIVAGATAYVQGSAKF